MKYHTCTRLLSLVLAVVMALSLLSVAAFAAVAPDYAHLEIGTASGQPGGTVKIPVYVKGIKDGQRCRGFDTTVVLGENLTAAGVEWTSLVSGFGYKIYNKDSGYLTATDIMNSGFRITADGKVCDLLVKIADDATSVGAVNLINVSISGEQSTDFLNSTDGTMATRDLDAVVTPTDEDGNPVPVVSIKEAASFTMNVTADKTSVTAGEDVTVTVEVTGGSFVAAAAKLGYDSSKFSIKTADTSTGWSENNGGYAYYNVNKDGTPLNSTLGTFVFTAIAQTTEVAGSFTLSETFCEETLLDGASTVPSTPCGNNGSVEVTIALKDDLPVTAENKTVTYNGNEQAFNEVICSVEGASIAYGETEGTYDLTAVPSKTDVGTYTLYYQVTAPGYAPKTGSYTLTINPAAIEYTATGFDGTYDGNNHTISVTVTNPTDAVITYSDEEDGTYTEEAPKYSAAPTNATVWFKITANSSNYVDVKDSRIVKIDEADMTVDITANERVTYDGQPHVSATINQLIPSYASIDYMWGTTQVGAGSNTPPSFTDAGTYEIWWTASRAGYKVKTGSYTFIIDKADIDRSSFTITANPDVNYDGEAHVSATATIPEGMTVTYTYGGQNYSVIPSFTDIGIYTVNYTVSAGDNYNDATGSYTFTIKDGTIEATSTGVDTVYDGNSYSITVTVTKPSDTKIEYSTTGEEGSWSTTNPGFTDVGTYTVYWKVTKDGYTEKLGQDTVNIKKATLTGYSVTANPDATYDGAAHESATVTLPAGATITYTCNEVAYNTIPSFTDVGTYTVSYTITAGPNYTDVTDTYTFIIKEGTLDVTSSDYNAAYDGQAHTITVTGPEGATITYSDSENGTYSADAPTLTNVGSTTVYWKVEKNGYTTVTGHNTITITKRAATITINDQTKSIGDADPAFTAAVNGLVDPDDLGTITFEREAGETEGRYKITPKYYENPNYDITIEYGYLTITAADFVVETVADYVTGYSLVLVYTDGRATFTYDGAAMYDVTSAGYTYKTDEGVTSYDHVYALVVAGEAEEAMVAAGTTPVADTLNCADLDVNKSGSVDLRDAVAVVAVYNANETYMTNYMSIVLEADVNHDKHVDGKDFGAIKAEYLK